MKKMATLLIALIFIGIFQSPPALSHGGPHLPSSPVAPGIAVNIYFNEELLILDVPAQIFGGRTLIPLRALLERIGATVYWTEDGEIVTIHEGTRVSMRVGGSHAYVNGVPTPMVLPPTIISGRTLLPLRFMAETFGFLVEWHEARFAVLVRTPPRTPDNPPGDGDGPPDNPPGDGDGPPDNPPGDGDGPSNPPIYPPSPPLPPAEPEINRVNFIQVLHAEEVPYWEWSVLDEAYLLGLTFNENTLLREIYLIQGHRTAWATKFELVNNFYFFPSHVVGIKDALNRAINSRVQMINAQGPAPYDTNMLGAILRNFFIASINVDTVLQAERNDKELRQILLDIPFDTASFLGAVVVMTPFKIVSPEGTRIGGIASPNIPIISVNAGNHRFVESVFYHELGHIWDFKFLTHEEEALYLEVRGRQGFVSGTAWADRTAENLAEDFRVVMDPVGVLGRASSQFLPHMGNFGEPNAEETAALREFFLRKMSTRPPIRQNAKVKGSPFVFSTYLTKTGDIPLTLPNLSPPGILSGVSEHRLDTHNPPPGTTYTLKFPRGGFFSAFIGSFQIRVLHVDANYNR